MKKSTYKEYIEYLKDNPKGYWFRARVFGWGWVPATWQGWLVHALFIVLIILNFFRIDANSHSASDTLRPFIIQTFIMVLVLIGICYKTGEKPRWNWGLPRKRK